MSRAQLTSTDQQNSGGPVSPFLAGKNKIINGDFGIWQRGTSFTNPAGGFTADRWAHNADGSGKTIVISQQTFTPGTAPVAGYEGTYFYRLNQTVAGTGGTFNVFQTGLEDVRLFAGQTVTLSLWAKADASRLLGFTFVQDFGSGGSSTVGTFLTGPTLTTAWSRYSVTLTIPSVAGKTIGTSSALRIQISVPVNTTQTVDVWGVQLEAGSVATPFTTASGTLQGELALCQRYYIRFTATDGYGYLGNPGMIYAGNTTRNPISLPVAMRTYPTSLDYASICLTDILNSYSGGTWTIVSGGGSVNCPTIQYAHTSSSMTVYHPAFIQCNATPNGYFGFSAEL